MDDKTTPSQVEDIRDADHDGTNGFSKVVDEAELATTKEHSMTLWQGLKLYPKAMGWSVFLSTAIIMEGFDVVLMGSFYAYPTFQAKYGELLPNGTYGLTAPWQAALSNGINVGAILGLFLNGIISERYGYKKTMVGAVRIRDHYSTFVEMKLLT